MTTRLERLINNGGAAVPAVDVETRLTKILAGVRGAEKTLPVIGKVYIALVGIDGAIEADAGMWANMTERKLTYNGATELLFEASRAARTLARAVREPDQLDVHVGTEAQWLALDPDIVTSAWYKYGDVREELMPLDLQISETDNLGIKAAIKKKDATLLLSFGVAKLAGFLLTTADPPAD